MILAFVRHGQSMGNAWDGAYKQDAMNFLTPMGVAQAEVAGWKLAYTQLRFDHMISSDMTRARQTMAIIAHITGDWQRDFIVEPKLDERNSDPNVNYYYERMVHKRQVKNAWNNVILPALKTGNTLVVTHHYTMEELFELAGFANRLWSSEDVPRIPNAVAYIYDTQTKDLTILNDETKTPIMV